MFRCGIRINPTFTCPLLSVDPTKVEASTLGWWVLKESLCGAAPGEAVVVKKGNLSANALSKPGGVSGQDKGFTFFA